MKEQLISFETAKLAKEKGFDIPTYSNYSRFKITETTVNQINWNGRYLDRFPLRFNAPTQSLLQKWIREKHVIYIETQYHPSGFRSIIRAHYTLTGNRILKTELFKNYEEALEYGLQEALKLIKTK